MARWNKEHELDKLRRELKKYEDRYKELSD